MARRPTSSINPMNAADLDDGDERTPAGRDRGAPPAGRPPQHPRVRPARRQRRQQHQRQHHRQVLDDQPADGDAAPLRFDQPPLLQRTQQDDRAGHRQGQAENEPARPAEAGEQRPWTDLRSRRARDRRTAGDPSSEKCSPTPNISRMTPSSASSGASAWSATKPGVCGPTHDAGEEVAPERRNAQPIGDGAEYEGQPEARHDRGDERRLMRHAGRGFPVGGGGASMHRTGRLVSCQPLRSRTRRNIAPMG